MNMENIMAALAIMGNGMAGIFAAILIIMLCVWIMSRMGKKK